jgi:gluconolactonase
MYPPPQRIETKVFARLPDSLRATGRRSPWADARQHKDVHSFIEGPAFDRNGALYCTDIAFGRIFSIDAQGQFEVVADYGGEPNGMKIHRDGRAFIADHRLGLLTLDIASGEVTPLLDRAWGEAFRGLNDLVFASNGDLYFTDQGQSGLQDPCGRVFRLRANGVLECVLDRIPSPNGLALNADESVLFLNVTRANAVWRVPLDRHGHASKVGVFLHLSGGSGPDGLAIDEDGNLAVAMPGTGSVWMFSPQGEPLFRIVSCAGIRPTNLAFGGADRCTLFITESGTGSILSAQLPSPGLRLFSHC